MLRSFRQRQRQLGGAMVELAIGTLVFVPLCFYGAWFADVVHLGIKLQEASITPAWDATAFKQHDFQSPTAPDSLYSSAISKARTGVVNDISTTYDSADPGGNPSRVSFMVKAEPITINCGRSGGSGDAPNNSQGSAKNYVNGRPLNMLGTSSWVTCSSRTTLTTIGMPKKDDQDLAHVDLVDSNFFSGFTFCGVGPGLRGCNAGNAEGFSLMMDDWGTEKGTENALKAGSPGGNNAYWNVAKAFFNKNNPGNSAVLAGMGAVTMIPMDLGNTSAFRLSYRRLSDGSFEKHEKDSGQSGAHGGPTGNDSPHTGGGWHEEHNAHPDLTKRAFDTRENQKYMANSNWPSD